MASGISISPLHFDALASTTSHFTAGINGATILGAPYLSLFDLDLYSAFFFLFQSAIASGAPYCTFKVQQWRSWCFNWPASGVAVLSRILRFAILPLDYDDMTSSLLF